MLAASMVFIFFYIFGLLDFDRVLVSEFSQKNIAQLASKMGSKKNATGVAGFWHVGRIGTWRDVMIEQMQEITESGIDVESKAIHTVLVGSDQEDIPVNHSKLKLFWGGSLTSYEFPTLSLMQQYCHENPDDKVWYIHTKGSMNGSKNKW